MEFKTNWTSSDYLNYTDINNILEKMEYVNNQILEFKDIKVLDDKARISMKHFPFADFLNDIESDIEKLGENAYLSNNWIELKTDWKVNDPIDFSLMNRLENNLKYLYEYFRNNINEIPYCGNVKAGDYYGLG
ncbi:MAG TPA: hypothetical protein VIG40_05555 [Tissierellaceae bacterium]